MLDAARLFGTNSCTTGPGQVRQHSIRIGVGFQNSTPPAIATQTPIVAKSRWLLLGPRALELFKLSFVASEIDGEEDSVLIMLNSSFVSHADLL
jgi:hypothetical protein